MKVSAICLLVGLVLASGAAAQGASSAKGQGSGESSKSLSAIRSLVHELQGRTEKLSDEMNVYRSMVEQKPKGGGDEKWSAALERQLKRIDAARASVVEGLQQLDQAAKGSKLPTSLGKDVANAHNEADAQRAAAEQALAQNKAVMNRPKKAPKKAEEKPVPELPADLDL
jgi:hypothetical protein